MSEKKPYWEKSRGESEKTRAADDFETILKLMKKIRQEEGRE